MLPPAHSEPALSGSAGSPGRTERRKSARSRAHGVVQLLLEDPAPQVICGRLIDVSESGFRAAHHCPSLSSGQEVRFTHGLARGRARVVWTITRPNTIESGFLILGT